MMRMFSRFGSAVLIVMMSVFVLCRLRLFVPARREATGPNPCRRTRSKPGLGMSIRNTAIRLSPVSVSVKNRYAIATASDTRTGKPTLSNVGQPGCLRNGMTTGETIANTVVMTFLNTQFSMLIHSQTLTALRLLMSLVFTAELEPEPQPFRLLVLAIHFLVVVPM